MKSVVEYQQFPVKFYRPSYGKLPQCGANDYLSHPEESSLVKLHELAQYAKMLKELRVEFPSGGHEYSLIGEEIERVRAYAEVWRAIYKDANREKLVALGHLEEVNMSEIEAMIAV